jgi:hypothetical protein
MECARIAEKMSWASKRDAKIEDQAYSLMGFFGVKTSLGYGEGCVEASHRLQLNILRILDDDSILAYEPFKEVKNE